MQSPKTSDKPKSHPQWVLNRIMGFFNQARSVEDLLDGTIKDDPADGSGNTMGPTLAARILRERSALPRRRFTEFSQLDSIQGVGNGTLDDLFYTFNVTAAQAFQKSMYDSNTIYRDNWPLEYFRTTFDDPSTFNDLVNNEALFRTWVADKIAAICAEKGVSESDCEHMITQINTAYIDSYHNTTQAPGYALALWFYKFDADNWFSWLGIQTQCVQYFNHHMGGFPWAMELRFFKGFRQKGIMPAGINPPDLPVVVNWPEQAITIWVSTLYD